MQNKITTKSPLLILAFNRPGMTKRLLESLPLLTDRVVYVSLDGPRPSNPKDLINIKTVLEIFQDYEKKVGMSFNYLISENNLGCKNKVSKSISAVLEKHDRTIILEDDCMPSSSFFPYCDELLSRYEDNARTMMINGSSFTEPLNDSGQYRWSKCVFVWGWATWRRAWVKYNPYLESFAKDSAVVLKSIGDYYGNWGKPLVKLIQNVYEKNIDTWDAQWVYTIWQNKGVTIMPTKNLISNIGFGKEATHTKVKMSLGNLPTHKLEFPLKCLADNSGLDNNHKYDLEQYMSIYKRTSVIDVGLYMLSRRLCLQRFIKL